MLEKDRFAKEVANSRAYLMNFARLQLRNEAWAEDAVSETIMAALAKPQAFINDSTLRTWLVGILKHKIVDTLRTHMREINMSAHASYDEETGEIAELSALNYDSKGFYYKEANAQWGNALDLPSDALERKQFIRVLEACAGLLPKDQARAFLMREWLGLGSPEVCKILDLPPAHLYVLLHRARLRLRECLTIRWYSQEPYCELQPTSL